jgi:ATP/maltotriose-dependent transcriptional regulator MalT
LQGQHPQAAVALERAAKQETQLAIAWVGGSARLLQAHLYLQSWRVDSALAIVKALVGEWEQAGTPGCAALDGPIGLRVLRLAAQRGDAGARRILQIFPETVAGGAQTPLVAATTKPAASAALPDSLTQRERDVLRLIVAGRTNRQIGEELFITAETVKSHVVHILRKLDVASRTQAAIKGRELGV